jgi:hypothetical protein
MLGEVAKGGYEYFCTNGNEKETCPIAFTKVMKIATMVGPSYIIRSIDLATIVWAHPQFLCTFPPTSPEKIKPFEYVPYTPVDDQRCIVCSICKNI